MSSCIHMWINTYTEICLNTLTHVCLPIQIPTGIQSYSICTYHIQVCMSQLW